MIRPTKALVLDVALVVFAVSVVMIHVPVRAGDKWRSSSHTLVTAVLTDALIAFFLVYGVADAVRRLCHGGGVLVGVGQRRTLTISTAEPVSLGTVTLGPKQRLRVRVEMLKGPAAELIPVSVRLSEKPDGSSEGETTSQKLVLDATAIDMGECVLGAPARERRYLALDVQCPANPSELVELRVAWAATLALAAR